MQRQKDRARGRPRKAILLLPALYVRYRS
ncbi:hypothetical protein DEM27_03415 [Metarhizobium album]|uniref:Uncharacterized protein n=1 Tax=Metarhizobium album TaxID=2182425 RepID=A0A2U2DYW6_9HYPH|nr:hypothetical protein DEM27_03415 [Rhizobium album]